MLDREVVERLGVQATDGHDIYVDASILAELLRVYRLWLDGEWAGCSDCNEMGEWKNKRCEECGGSGYFRLVRDGDSGEGQS